MPSVPLSNVVASLSHALDLTEGQAPGHALRACEIGMELGQAIGLSDEELSVLYYTLLLKDAGCSANAAPVADAFGSDDHSVKRDLKTTNWANYVSAVWYVARNVGLGSGFSRKLAAFVRVAQGGPKMAREFTRIRCERGAEIARRIGFEHDVAESVRALDEHWDGAGHPYGVAGDAIPLPARIACIAQTVEVFLGEFGRAEALAMVAQRKGTWFDPELASEVLSWEDRSDFWERVQSIKQPDEIRHREPEGRALAVDEEGLDRIAEAFADVIDAKSPYTSSHSRRVARIAASLGEVLGVSARRQQLLYRAGLLHDIGKLGVSNRILDKPGRLTDAELQEVKKHPRFSREILDPVEAFRSVLAPASFHHERLDGSGYPWGLGADQLDLDCRIVAAADVFEALTATRPYRESLDVVEVEKIMRRDAGRALDGEVLDALFASEAAAGAVPSVVDEASELPSVVTSRERVKR